MNLLKRFPFSVALVLLILLGVIHEGAPTLLLSSLLAMSGGLMMGKMTLGGLMMMLMAANQQQNGQNLFRNLGNIPAPGGVSVPTGTTSAAYGGRNFLTEIQNLINKRGIREKRAVGNVAKNSSKQVAEIDAELQYRVMRQVANSDPLGCLPQALCGLSANPPSTKSNLMNDYAYLLKTVFTREEDIDDLDQDDDADLDKFDDLKDDPPNKKNSQKGLNSIGKTRTKTSASAAVPTRTKVTEKTKNKKPHNEEESSEEVANDQDMDKLMMKEAFEMEHLANEELLEEDPDFFPYAMRDSGSLKYGPYGGNPKRPQDMRAPDEPEDYVGVAQSDLNKMSDSELDEMLARIQGPGHGPPGRRPPGRGPPGRGPGGPTKSPPGSSSSFLSNLMPKVSLGFTPAKTGNNFQEDPFFSGFKRSIKSGEFMEEKVRHATEEEQEMFKEMIVRRRKRRDFLLRKKKELSEIKDPVEKFRIAADFGERVKSPRQCRILFNNCPFNYTQVLEMIAGLRNAVMGQSPDLVRGREKDTVVVLNPVMPAIAQQSGTKNIINLNTGTGGGSGGVTTIQHELPTGEMMEINLQMTGTKRRPNRPKVSTSASYKLGESKTKRRKPADVQDLFDEDDQSPDATTSKPKIQSSLGSLESLKATMLAIEKINNITVERRKQGKPINYSNVMADILESKGVIKPQTVNIPTPHPHPVTRPPAKKRNNPKPQINYQRPKKTSALNSALSQLSVSTSVALPAEDDEVEETLPVRKPSPSFPPRNKKVTLSQAASGSTLAPPVRRQSPSKGQIEKDKEEDRDEEGAEDEEASDEEYEEDDDDNESPDEFRSGVKGVKVVKEPQERVIINVPLKETKTAVGTVVATQIFEKRRSPSQRGRWRKPKKLYPDETMIFRRIFPL